jgi:hypothetical protein
MWVIMKAVLNFALVALCVLGMTVPEVGHADEPNDIKNCYSVHGEARYGPLAYKHVVIVTNRCELSLACEVWTDVDPTPKQSLTVEPKGTGEVIVRTSSPARAFKAFGECKKQ